MNLNVTWVLGLCFNLSSFYWVYYILDFLNCFFLSSDSVLSYWLLFLQESAVSLRSPKSQLLLPDSSFPCIITVTCKPHDSSSDELQYYAPQVGIIFSFLGVIKWFIKTFSCLKTGLRSKLFLKSWHLGDTKVASEHDCNGKNAQRRRNTELSCLQAAPFAPHRTISAVELYTMYSCSPFIVLGFGCDD